MKNEEIFNGAFSEKKGSQYPFYKRDRYDIYTVAYIVDDTLTLNRIIGYNIMEVNCYPDCDW